MQVTIDQFRANIERVRTLGAIYSNSSGQTIPGLDFSDLLRSELVMAVSALDYYIHEIVRLNMLDIFHGNRPETPAFLRFQVSLESVRHVINIPTSTDWLDDEIRTRHSWQSFQHPNKIANAIRLISDVKLWEETGNHLGMPPQEVRGQLNNIIIRRNQIAHEADMNPVLPDSPWPIDETLVDEAVNFIEQIAEAIYDIIT